MPGSAVLSAPEGDSRKEKKPLLSEYTQSKQVHLKAMFVENLKIMMMEECYYPVITKPGFGKCVMEHGLYFLFSYVGSICWQISKGQPFPTKNSMERLFTSLGLKRLFL